MVIWSQNKLFWVILEKPFVDCCLIFIKMEKRKVYNPF